MKGVNLSVKCRTRRLLCNDKVLISTLRGNDDADFYTLFPTPVILPCMTAGD